jgi:hypothetical protein
MTGESVTSRYQERVKRLEVLLARINCDLWSPEGEFSSFQEFVDAIDKELESANWVISALALAEGSKTETHVLTDVVWSIDGAGLVRSRSFLTEELEGIKADRIRYCLVCGKLFYAHRKLSKGCRGKCAATLRKRRQREPMTAEQTKERAKEYKRAQRKAQKALKEAKQPKERT